MKYLIVNADDLGYSDGVNAGIARAFNDGMLTSASLMVNQPGTGQAIELLAKGKLPPTGVHLVLTCGQPVSPSQEVPALVEPGTGCFKNKAAFFGSRIDTRQVIREFAAQIDQALTAGVEITHLDSHHHVHNHPDVLPAYIAVARRYGLPARNTGEETKNALRRAGVPTPDNFCGCWFGTGATFDSLVKVLHQFSARKGEVLEIMTHPGFADGELLSKSSYGWEREKELAVLCRAEIKTILSTLGLKPASFKVLTTPV